MKTAKLMLPMILLVASGSVFAASEEDAHMSFETLDQDGDGIVNRDEAEAAPRLAESFDQLDANADGELSEDEIGVGGPETEEEPAVDTEEEPAVE